MTSVADRLIDRLYQLKVCALQGIILRHLRAHCQPMSSAQISRALSAPDGAVARAVDGMLESRRIARVGYATDGYPAYRPVEIGLCEWCGLLDHYLVAGECQACAASVSDPTRPAHARHVC